MRCTVGARLHREGLAQGEMVSMFTGSETVGPNGFHMAGLCLFVLGERTCPQGPLFLQVLRGVFQAAGPAHGCDAHSGQLRVGSGCVCAVVGGGGRTVAQLVSCSRRVSFVPRGAFPDRGAFSCRVSLSGGSPGGVRSPPRRVCVVRCAGSQRPGLIPWLQ